MAIDGELLFSLVAPYISDYDRVKVVTEGVNGLDREKAFSKVATELKKSKGTLTTDMKIVLDALGKADSD